MSAGHIFFSYRSTERDFATRLAQDVRRVGYPIWMDRLAGIRPGDDWVQTLQDALNGSAGLISVLSPAYVTSSFCRKELQRAVGLNKLVIPILLKQVTPEQWPLEIQAGQYVDFTGWHDPSAYAASLSELIDHGLSTKLAMKPVAGADSEPAPAPGPALPGRDLEDGVADALESAARTATTSRLAAMKIQSYTSALTTLQAQWQAAFDQRLSTLNMADKIPLTKQLEYYERQIQETEALLAAVGP